MIENDDRLDEYILRHIEPESDYLHALYRATNIHLLRPRMASGHLQGRMLKMFVLMNRPHNILEIGTYSGYSALCMAEGLPEGGKVYTFEVNDEQEAFTRPWIEKSGYAGKIEFIIGDVMQELPLLAEEKRLKFQMAFIDGDKRHYIDYYNAIFPYLTPGAIILADNTLWDGHVVEADHQKDTQTRGVMAFNDYVNKDKRVEVVILPMRDGLSVIRKREL